MSGESYGLFQTGPPPVPYELPTAEKLALLGSAMAESMGQMLEEMRGVFGRSAYVKSLAEPGYLGNRCGWYPAKPKRKRRSAT